MTTPLNLMVTLWPSFPHFERFIHDHRLRGIRLNSAMMALDELDKELEIVKTVHRAGFRAMRPVPLYFDVKGRQLRVREVKVGPNLELVLNHPIEVETPVTVLFKAGADRALLTKVVDGTQLIFDGGPEFMVKPGESLHIRHPSLKVKGDVFSDFEIKKIEKVVAAGFKRYFLSYVEEQRDIDMLRELVGKDAEIIAKIENMRGMQYLVHEFVKQPGLSVMAARGDLYVEVAKPHDILAALKFIIQKDPEAHVGSRILLSLVNSPVPEMADMADLAWLYDLGYRNMMLCDELCLKEPLLARAVNCLDAFKQAYAT